MRDPVLERYRAPALAFTGYLVLQAASAAALFALKLGDPDGVRAFYLGSTERFTVAKSLAGMLEVAVPHLVAIPLVLFAAAHVVGFARALPAPGYRALVAASFGAALAGILSGFGVRWVAPELAWLKIASFAALEAALVAWAGLLGAVFLPRRAACAAGAATVAEAGAGTR